MRAGLHGRRKWWAAAGAVCAGLVLAGCTSVTEVRTRVRNSWTRSPVVVPFAKIVRGGKNVVLSPLEVPATVIRAERRATGVVSATGALVQGAGQGVVNGTVRFAAGVGEMASFPLVFDADPWYERRLGEPALSASGRATRRR